MDGADAPGAAEVRLLAPAEWEVYREIRLRALATDPEAFGSTLEREAAFDESAWRSRCEHSAQLVAVAKEEVLGVATTRPREDDAATFDLFGLFVRPDGRRRGVGRLLVDSAIALARERGGQRLVLMVVESNDAARGLYLACGLRPTGRYEPMPGRPGVREEELALSW